MVSVYVCTALKCSDDSFFNFVHNVICSLSDFIQREREREREREKSI